MREFSAGPLLYAASSSQVPGGGPFSLDIASKRRRSAVPIGELVEHLFPGLCELEQSPTAKGEDEAEGGPPDNGEESGEHLAHHGRSREWHPVCWSARPDVAFTVDGKAVTAIGKTNDSCCTPTGLCRTRQEPRPIARRSLNRLPFPLPLHSQGSSGKGGARLATGATGLAPVTRRHIRAFKLRSLVCQACTSP